MNIVCVVPVSNNEIYASHFGKSVERFSLGVVNIGIDPDHPENNPIIRRMAIGVNYALQNKMVNPDTIVVFSKENVVILDNLLSEKIFKVFTDRPDVGIIGVEGIDSIDRDWDLKYSCGHYIQASSGEAVGNGNHIVNNSKVGFFDDCVAVSNSLFAVRGSLILSGLIPNCMQFTDDEKIYSFDMCFQAMSMGSKIAVADILIYDGSQTMFDSEHRNIFSKQINSLLDVFTSFGNKLPVTTKSFAKKANEIVTIDL